MSIGNHEFLRLVKEVLKENYMFDGPNIHELYADAYMLWDWNLNLKMSQKMGLFVFSSHFDKISVDFLEDMDVQA